MRHEASTGDHRGYVYVAGYTNSADFPGNQRALQPNHGEGLDAFLLKLDADNRQIIYSTFWGGSNRDMAMALTVGPGEAATLAGVTYSADLPLARALQTKLGSLNDAFVAQICDPWLGYWFGDLPVAAFTHVTGGERPQALEGVVFSGCTQKFDAAGPESDQPWLTVVRDGDSVPMKLRLEVNPEGWAPGEHKATMRVTVREAFRPVLEIPVVLTVAEPLAAAGLR